MARAIDVDRMANWLVRRGLIQGLVIWYGKTQSRILSSRPPPPFPRSRPKTRSCGRMSFALMTCLQAIKMYLSQSCGPSWSR